jgi:hypothetical protein
MSASDLASLFPGETGGIRVVPPSTIAPPSPAPLSQIRAALERARPECTVYACSQSEHVLQIYAALYGLHESGQIRLRQRFSLDALRARLAAAGGAGERLDAELHGLLAEVEGAGLVFFDVRDDADYYRGIADAVALYAKRSFRSGAYGRHAARFVPLGLNYSVYPDRTGAPELLRTLRQLELTARGAKRIAFALARLFPAAGRALGGPTVGALSDEARCDLPARAIFLARTWVPEEVCKNLPQARDDVARLNDFRAACIRRLRLRFGERFLGGFARSAHACELYPDCVVDASIGTRRRAYLARLKSYPVCVATTGLFESIGWKFAEYVALAKAIACEPLRFELPGPIAAGRNFLEFDTPEACAEQVGRLMEDDGLRKEMMSRNAAYYAEHGTPAAVVGRVVHAALLGKPALTG